MKRKPQLEYPDPARPDGWVIEVHSDRTVHGGVYQVRVPTLLWLPYRLAGCRVNVVGHPDDKYPYFSVWRGRKYLGRIHNVLHGKPKPPLTWDHARDDYVNQHRECLRLATPSEQNYNRGPMPKRGVRN